MQGFELQFSFFRGSVEVDDFTPVPLLVQEFYLKAAFIGSVLLFNEANRYGPMHVEWMDDPAGCRGDQLSTFAPVAPPSDPLVWSNNPSFDASLYCEGDEYLPAELPAGEPTTQPSGAPTSTPSISFPPTSAPTYSAIGQEQLEGLRIFHNATMMSSAVSRELHNWFTMPDYCSFTGVTCDDRGFVIILDLTDTRLAGTLPSSMEKLGRLRQLKVVNNRVKGAIPDQLCDLEQLTQIELGANQFTGSVPTCLHKLRHLRRLLLQYNSLSGSIPHEVCQFSQLVAFDISFNLGMYGEIPKCMGSLPLEVLRVDNVGLVGHVPPLLCGRNFINGLSPNPYGCNTIACPAGTYEPTLGRTYNNVTECIDCDFPSNVIGSTTCRYVQNNTVISVTAGPSLPPSLSPSLLPATEAPTFNMANMTTSPSLPPHPLVNETSEPSISPSSQPSFTPTKHPSLRPSSVLSTYPSLGPELVYVTVVFANVQATLDSDAVETFALETKAYLTSETIVVERVAVLSQSIGNASSLTHISFRRLEYSLVVAMEIEGRSTDSSLLDQVQAALVNSFSNYSSFLLESLPALTPVAPTPAPIQIQQQNEIVVEQRNNITNWWLLGSAVALSVVAVISVLFVRQSRRAHRDGIRAFPVEQTAVAVSNYQLCVAKMFQHVLIARFFCRVHEVLGPSRSMMVSRRNLARVGIRHRHQGSLSMIKLFRSGRQVLMPSTCI